MSLRKEYVDGMHGQVHVLRNQTPVGQARPLVCLHLSPGSGRMYEELALELEPERAVLAPDTPGFGASDAPAGPLDIEALAENLVAVLDAYGIDECDLLGYHTGSKIAVQTALAFPGRVRSLVLVSAPVYTDSELSSQRGALAVARQPSPDGSHLVEQFTELVRWTPAEVPLAYVQREFAEQQRGGEAAHWGYLAAFGYSHAQALPRVQQPVLLLVPEDDLEGPSLRAAALVRNGRTLHLPGWGHQMMRTRTAEVASLVREHTGQD